jgi:hypothetical protein
MAIIWLLFSVATPAYLPLQIYTLVCWRGFARISALGGLLVMLPFCVLSGMAWAKDSNLWGIFIAFGLPVGTVYLVTLIVLKFLLARLTRKKTGDAEVIP